MIRVVESIIAITVLGLLALYGVALVLQGLRRLNVLAYLRGFQGGVSEQNLQRALGPEVASDLDALERSGLVLRQDPTWVGAWSPPSRWSAVRPTQAQEASAVRPTQAHEASSVRPTQAQEVSPHEPEIATGGAGGVDSRTVPMASVARPRAIPEAPTLIIEREGLVPRGMGAASSGAPLRVRIPYADTDVDPPRPDDVEPSPR